MTQQVQEKQLQLWLPEILDIAGAAGGVLMKHYKDAALNIELKQDSSPVTAADKESSALIVTRLQQLTPDITVISEENTAEAEQDKRLYWTVDPLDGTKGFIAQNDHFYVKIALVEDGCPVLGVIHEPVHQRFFYSTRDGSARCRTPEADKIITSKPVSGTKPLRTLFNELHYSRESYDAARNSLSKRGLNVPPLEQAKGLCKTAFYMAVAKGEADIFVNCAKKPSLQDSNGFSWDYAPDWLILKNAGGAMIDLTTGRMPRFNEPRKRTNAMIGLGDIELGKRLFPELKKDCV
ncbi:MAG: 3'(2'),5'-bisphosphate nucleotidase CysQ [Rhodospirillales bacterium]|nr:3'(2'),5'-bisphosphate nucleotidase CysQ [Rhodospirillales bacterium]MCB9996921.1 3'(2'),5'-bisphosphate nucleotidase CysQ [Rhodospirillales bacterium]